MSDNDKPTYTYTTYETEPPSDEPILIVAIYPSGGTMITGRVTKREVAPMLRDVADAVEGKKGYVVDLGNPRLN